jgi:hypothetical protein
MSSDRRPLWQPFSEPAIDTPLQTEAEKHRLLPVERAPFQEPPATADIWQPAAPGRRPLGPGGNAFSSPDAER